MTEEGSQTLVVPEGSGSQRLDRWLVDNLPGLSRARVKRMLDEGQVRVNGRRPRKGDLVTPGATVELRGAAPPEDFTPVAEALELTVRLEEGAFAVVDKPSGMATHPLRPEERGTLCNRVVSRWPETALVGYRRREPGVLHRLDTDTSGLVLVARTTEAFDALREAMKAGSVRKRYQALVEARVTSEGRVDHPLIPHRKDPRRVEAVTEHVRVRAGTRLHEAHTRYRPLRAVGAFTLLEVELETAFRHQVRAHLAELGHPLVGDLLYRGPMLPEALGLGRHFLHATELSFPHPVTGKPVTVSSPLAPDLEAVLGALASESAP
ncbi:MAG: RluA family pseudouridine synthase [Deltaproteobacteria bacterium]|nr:RluA family pseudouridine synthase [Deltaproteobacteria bacterium]